jgi:predicted acylesterase/phospholipase RssA
MQDSADKNYDTLALSGGAINGLVMLGSLQYCSDNKMLDKIKTYVGTSAGAIICYLMIIGYTPIEIIVYLCTKSQVFQKLKYFDINSGCRGDGATTFLHISEYLEQMTTEKIGRLLNMRDIQTLYNVNFICTTFNVTKNITEYISPETHPDVPCLSALRMSANLPLVFENYKYGNSFYVDGGICNNFPLNIGESNGERVLGIVIKYPQTASTDVYPQKNMLAYVYRILSAMFVEMINQRIANKKSSSTVIKLDPMDDFDILKFDIDSKHKLDMFSFGYNQVAEQL